MVLFFARITALEGLSRALHKREKLIAGSRELGLENGTGKLTLKGIEGTIL